MSSIAALASIAVAGAFAVWVFFSNGADSAYGGASLLSRPSIAVLPLDNLSAIPEQEYFSDGVTDDIINDLSKFSNLTVIARNSAFAFKGRTTSAKKIGEELDVEYVLEGSVQRADGRVRINTQLVDTQSQRQLWAARYDEPVGNVFEVQDRITRQIVQALSVRVSEIEERRAFSQTDAKFSAYDLALRARALLRTLNRADNFEARGLYRRSLELDPGYSSAYAGLGWTHFNAMLYGWTDAPQTELQKAEKLARRAIDLNQSGVDGHRLLAGVHLQRRQHHLAVLELERAIAINPNDADSHAEQGITFVYAGRLEAAVRSLELALRIDPSRSADAMMHLGMALYLQGEFENALTWLERGIARNPENVFIHVVLAAAYGQLGRYEESKRTADVVRRLDPFFKVDQFGRLFAEPKHRQHVVAGLRKSGLD